MTTRKRQIRVEEDENPSDRRLHGRRRWADAARKSESEQGSEMIAVVSLPKPDELRKFVRGMLCDRDRLEPAGVPFSEAPVKRGGKICGIYFEVQGPRLMRSHAIWVYDEHRILFYDSTGTRFAEVRLAEAPDPREGVTPREKANPKVGMG